MKDLLKAIIKDFHVKPLPEFIERTLSVPINSGKIISIVGSRRAGKTYFMYQLISKLLASTNINIIDIIYINFEDERLNLKIEDLHLLIDSYYELYPDNTNELYFFFDEIQNINNWERFVRRLYDSVSKNIFITGSSSKLLSKEVSTSLRGRSVAYEMFPLTFKEYLQFFKIDSDDTYSTRNKSKIIKTFKSYLTQGGFPEVVHYKDDFRTKTLQSYLDVMIYRDIIERYEISNPVALKYIIKKSISNVSNYLSINKLYNELKSSGIKISKDSIYLFLNYIQDCYLLFLVNIYSESINVQNTNDKKIYCIDNGLANNVSFSFSENIGRLLENAVFINLKAKGNSIYYYSNARECDFVLQEKSKITRAIQVTAVLDSNNRTREIEGLLEALNKFKLKNGLILTLDQKETIKIENKVIEVEPAWKWLIEN